MVTTAAGDRLLHGDLSERVIGAYFNVYNAIGFGFLEGVYQRAMVAELCALGLLVNAEVPYQVFHRGQVVGEYRADLVVERRLIVECKSVERLSAVHEAQLLNYLHASGLSVGLLFNFGQRATFRRLARGSPKQSIPGNPR